MTINICLLGYDMYNLNVMSFDVGYCAEETNNEMDPSHPLQLNRAAAVGAFWAHCPVPLCPVLLCCNRLHSHVLLEHGVPFQIGQKSILS